MPELRWTLLLLGALFIAVLAWSERRKSRQSAGSRIPDATAPRSQPQREPVVQELTLPEIRARELPPPQDLPVVQVAEDESMVGLRIDGESAAPMPAAEVPDLPVLEAADAPDAQPEAEPDVTQSIEGASPPSTAAPTSETVEVDWPPEEDRRIIALRLVSSSPERLSGRAIRTALVAEGFIHGKFSIFHKPDAQHRAVLSAASLSKPGIFDMETMDSQRFSGVNLFAVLSGSQPARETFEQLLSCARNLNERLEGGLQDDRGGPLTPSRIAALRESFGGAAPALPNRPQ
jgi:FtsZ-interacting cell division protein ZipA